MSLQKTLRELEKISKKFVTSFDREGGVPVPTEFGKPDALSRPFRHHVINMPEARSREGTYRESLTMINGFQEKMPERDRAEYAGILTSHIHPVPDSDTPAQRAFAEMIFTGQDRVSTLNETPPSNTKKTIMSLFGVMGKNRDLQGSFSAAEVHDHELAHLYHIDGRTGDLSPNRPSIEAYAMIFSTAKALANGINPEDVERILPDDIEKRPEGFLSRLLTQPGTGKLPNEKDVTEIRNYGHGFIGMKKVQEYWDQGHRWNASDRDIGAVASRITREVAPDLQRDQSVFENHHVHDTADLANRSIIRHSYNQNAYFYPRLHINADATEGYIVTPMPEHLLPHGSLDPRENFALKNELDQWRKTFRHEAEHPNHKPVSVTTDVMTEPYQHENQPKPRGLVLAETLRKTYKSSQKNLIQTQGCISQNCAEL